MIIFSQIEITVQFSIIVLQLSVYLFIQKNIVVSFRKKDIGERSREARFHASINSLKITF